MYNNFAGANQIIDYLKNREYYDPLEVQITATLGTYEALEEFDIKVGEQKDISPVEPF